MNRCGSERPTRVKKYCYRRTRIMKYVPAYTYYTRTNGGGGDVSGWAEEGREASSRRPILGAAVAAVLWLARGWGIGFSVTVRRCARRASV